MRHNPLTAVWADDGRTVTVRLIPWNTPSDVTDDGGRTWYRESFTRGGLTWSGGRVLATNEHGTAPVGRLVSVANEIDGLYGVIRIADSAAGRDLRAMLDPDAPIIEGVSVEFTGDTESGSPGATVVRSAAELTGVAFTLSPLHAGATVVGVRSTPEETPTMSDTPDPIDDTPDPLEDDTPAETPAAAVRSHPASAPRREAPAPRRSTAGEAAGRFRSFGEYVQAVARGDVSFEHREMFGHTVANEGRSPVRHRAFEAAVSTDAAGMFGTVWTRDIIDLYRLHTPTMSAFSTAPLPDHGLVITQPKVADRPTVAVQASQGAEPSSNKMTITTASWNVATYAGGQNTSLQTILRSDPSYVDELMRLYTREMAVALNTAVTTALYAAANDVNTTSLEYVDADSFHELVIDASAIFLSTLHRTTEVVVMSVDLWKALGKAVDSTGRPLYPSFSGTNTLGSFSASTPTGNVVTVDYVVDPALGAAGAGIKAVFGVRGAFKTMTGPMGTLSADVPSTLTRDMAVYEFAAFGATDAAGLIQLVDAS